MLLRLKVAVLDHTREFHNAAQCFLRPPPRRLGRSAQCGNEIGGHPRGFPLLPLDGLYRVVQSAITLVARLLDCFQMLFVTLQRSIQRLQ